MLELVPKAAIARKPTDAEWMTLQDKLSKTYADRLATFVLLDDVVNLVKEAKNELIADGVLRDRPDLLSLSPNALESAYQSARELIGFAKPTFFNRINGVIEQKYNDLFKKRIKTLDWELFDKAVGVANSSAIEALMQLVRDQKRLARAERRRLASLARRLGEAVRR